VAVQFALNYEEGAETSVADGDECGELGMSGTIGGRIQGDQL
jgi:hypothetical protein